MLRWMLAMLATLVVAIAVCAVSADAEFRYHLFGGSADASWDSCAPVPLGSPCAFTQVEAATARRTRASLAQASAARTTRDRPVH